MKHSEIKTVIMNMDQSIGQFRYSYKDGELKICGLDLHKETKELIKKAMEAGITVHIATKEELGLCNEQGILNTYISSNVQMLSYKNIKLMKSILESEKIDLRKCIFISADRKLRKTAYDNGMVCFPHPIVAAYFLDGIEPVFVRIYGKRSTIESIKELLPYYIEDQSDHDALCFGIISNRCIQLGQYEKLKISVLPLSIPTEDVVILRKDYAVRQLERGIDTGLKVISKEDGEELVAVDSETVLDKHNLKGNIVEHLMPCPNLFLKITETPIDSEIMMYTRKLPSESMLESTLHIDSGVLSNLLHVIPSTSSAFKNLTDKYSGVSDLDSSGPIVSRHILHPDNTRVVNALLDQLSVYGYSPYVHTFSYNGHTYQNVIADLYGAGFHFINPKLLEKLRKILTDTPPKIWEEMLSELLGSKWVKDELVNFESYEMRSKIEDICMLKPYLPWWLENSIHYGIGSKIVIAGCHLDSTASLSAGYNPAISTAPGMDDNASGIASILLCAKYLMQYKDKLFNTVRFCFFNAEEQGMVGSKEYAAYLKSYNARVKVAVCPDMIGYNSDTNKIFELHAGYTDPTIRDKNVSFANMISDWACNLGFLSPAQIYKGTSNGSGPDRDVYDPAINRSDHAAFHQQGYPALAVSEDYFVNTASEPASDPNPNYHRTNDTTIDCSYASNITNALAYSLVDMARTWL